MQRTITSFWGLARATVLTAALVGLANPMRASADTTPIHIRETLEVDGGGVIKVHLDVKAAAGAYTQMKVGNPNLAAFLRRGWQKQPDWLSVQEFQGSYDDGASTIHFQWTVRGAVRPTSGNRWEVPLFGGDDADLISTNGETAILTWLTPTSFGQASVTANVVAPAGASDLRLAKAPARLTFQAPDAAVNAQAAAPEFTLDVKSQVMSCLAKAIGNPRFDKLWVARAAFRNNGGQSITDYRVRFRIKEYADGWTDWKASPRLAPGQGVVDAFFPLFDMNRLAVMEGSQQADLDVEYEYKGADGQMVHKTETRRLKLLDRNEVVYSGLPQDEMLDWNDLFEYEPYILSAFVTHDDPVIQQIAGLVAGQLGGANAAGSDEDAEKFMAALYDFMEANGIAYQTPPNGISEGEVFQHVKYGRDVMRNKAGTCIDLAIFYASVCEAVGLEPEMVGTRLPAGGHCFPVIVLPVSHNKVAVETTMVGRADFNAAAAQGLKTYNQVMTSCPYYLVPVQVLQGQGCTSIDLPKLPATVLKDWGVVAPRPAVTSNPRPTPGDAPAQGSLVGVWEADRTTAQGQTVHEVAQLTADGDIVIVLQDPASGTAVQVQLKYTYADGVLSLIKDNRILEQGRVTWLGPNKMACDTQEGRTIWTRTRN